MASDIDQVLGQISREELADLALALGNIDSPAGREKELAEYVEAWLRREGFRTKLLGLVPDRPNVVGAYKGSGGGYSLLFNSHMDTSRAEEDSWHYRDCRRPIDHGAWQEGDKLYGNGIVNDKGPMACFLIAAKAIKKAGIALKGDLLLTAVSGEIERAPVDEFQSSQYLSHEIGARSMVDRGVIADYALVAEATDFRIASLEAGKAVFKITLLAGPSLYAPYLRRPYLPENNPNAIVQMASLVSTIENWALGYQERHTYVSSGQTLVPTVNIGGIRGGARYTTCATPEVCALYVDVRTAPNQDVLAVKADLEELIRSLRFEGEVELFAFRRGYEAKNVDRLARAVEGAHCKLFEARPKPVVGPECSMWRDVNVFIEAGIPTVTYGPASGTGGGNVCITLDDLHRASQVYAMIALDVCGQEKPLQGEKLSR